MSQSPHIDHPPVDEIPTTGRTDTPGWSSRIWGVVAVVVIAFFVLGAALAIIVKVGRGPGVSNESIQQEEVRTGVTDDP